MKSITDMTWKDAAIVDCRVLSASIETACGKLSQVSALKRSPELRSIRAQFETCNRMAARLGDAIDRIPEAAPLISAQQADAIVGQLFHWLYDTPGRGQFGRPDMQLSLIATIVADSCHADITLQPLHDAYAREKAKRGARISD